MFGRIANVFDTEYETFGLLGNPAEVLSDLNDPRLLGPGAPIGGWVGQGAAAHLANTQA